MAVSTPPNQRNLHWAFVASVAIKGFNGVIETVLGLAFLTTRSLHRLIQYLSDLEMIADPHGWLAVRVHHVLQEFSVKVEAFAAVYLLVHGIIKLILAWGLLRDRRWAFPVSLVLLTAFVCYQLFRFAATGAIVLPFLASFDIVVIYLVWREYKKVLGRDRDILRSR